MAIFHDRFRWTLALELDLLGVVRLMEAVFHVVVCGCIVGVTIFSGRGSSLAFVMPCSARTIGLRRS